MTLFPFELSLHPILGVTPPQDSPSPRRRVPAKFQVSPRGFFPDFPALLEKGVVFKRMKGKGTLKENLGCCFCFVFEILPRIYMIIRMDIYIEEYMAEDFVISIILQMSFCLLKGDNIDNWWVLVEENLLVESVSTVPCFFFKFISLETMCFFWVPERSWGRGWTWWTSRLESSSIFRWQHVSFRGCSCWFWLWCNIRLQQ